MHSVHSALPTCQSPFIVRSLQLVEVRPYAEEEEVSLYVRREWLHKVTPDFTKHDRSRSHINGGWREIAPDLTGERSTHHSPDSLAGGLGSSYPLRITQPPPQPFAARSSTPSNFEHHRHVYVGLPYVFTLDKQFWGRCKIFSGKDGSSAPPLRKIGPYAYERDRSCAVNNPVYSWL